MKSIFVLFIALFFQTMDSFAQTSNKIEKAMQNPATKERSEKADALLIDKKKIMNEPVANNSAIEQKKKKGRKCHRSKTQ